jgi:DNA polymerase elongation subunit (family B)
MQAEMLEVMAGAESIAELKNKHEEVRNIFKEAVRCLATADPETLVINRRISRLTYAHHCLEGAAVQAYRDRGIEIAPGMKIGYVVRDARTYSVDTGWDAAVFDLPYYHNLLEKAWQETAFTLRTIPSKSARGQERCAARRKRLAASNIHCLDAQSHV